VKSLALAVPVGELLDVAAQVIDILIFVGVSLLPFQRPHQPFATRIAVRVRRQAHALNVVTVEDDDAVVAGTLNPAIGVVHQSRRRLLLFGGASFRPPYAARDSFRKGSPRYLALA
jgi:hypothetical protein